MMMLFLSSKKQTKITNGIVTEFNRTNPIQEKVHKCTESARFFFFGRLNKDRQSAYCIRKYTNEDTDRE